MDWVYYIIMLVVLIVGLFVNILGLPGLWLMVAAYGAYAWATGWEEFVGWPSLIAIVVLAILAEVVEFFAGAAGSKAAGGRTRGMVGAIVGGFLGAIFLSVIPIPIVAQIIGACLGAFVGAAVMEYSDKDADHAMRVGIGAAKGRFWGIVSKSAFGVVMFLVAMFAGLPLGRVASAPAAATAPLLLPTTQPTTQAATVPSTTFPSLTTPTSTSPAPASLPAEAVR